MALEEYIKKRNFSATEEPQGKVFNKTFNRFVVQRHMATKLHYDFRLELPEKQDGDKIVLKSWAIPKGLPFQKKVKHLAVETEDHPVDYLNFEGEIPSGNYGAGKVEIWDKGKFDIQSIKYKNNKLNVLKITLWGKKIKGDYVLVRLQNSSQWIIFKV